MCGLVYALFHGFFDNSNFQIERIQWSTQGKAAVVVKHWDDQALDGAEYFLLLDDHALTAREAKHAFYNKQAIFGTNQDCLDLEWATPSVLTVTCKEHFIGLDQIDVQKSHTGNVQIVYKNIGAK